MAKLTLLASRTLPSGACWMKVRVEALALYVRRPRPNIREAAHTERGWQWLDNHSLCNEEDQRSLERFRAQLNMAQRERNARKNFGGFRR